MKLYTLSKKLSIPSIAGIAVLMFVFILSNDSTHAQCAAVDQSQLNYNAGMSALNDVDRIQIIETKEISCHPQHPI